MCPAPSTMPRYLTAALQGMMANKSSKHMIYMVLFAGAPRAPGIQASILLSFSFGVIVMVIVTSISSISISVNRTFTLMAASHARPRDLA